MRDIPQWFSIFIYLFLTMCKLYLRVSWKNKVHLWTLFLHAYSFFYCKRSWQGTNPQSNPQLLKVVTCQRTADRFNLTVRKLTLSQKDNQELSLNTPGGIRPWPDQTRLAQRPLSQDGSAQSCMKHDLLSPSDTLPAKDCGTVSAQVCSWVWTQRNSRLSLNWVDTCFHVGEFMAQEKLGLDIEIQPKRTTSLFIILLLKMNKENWKVKLNSFL